MTGRDKGTRGGRNDLGTAAAVTVPRSRKLFSSLQFWGQMLLQMLGLSVGIGIVWCLLIPILNEEVSLGSYLPDLLQRAPGYMMLAGGVCAWIYPSALFQNYFPVLVSMNVTRRQVVLGIWLCNGVLVWILLGVQALCAHLGMGAFDREWLSLAFAGCMAMAAMGILIGMLVLWSRVAWAIAIGVLSIGTGFIVGLCCGMELKLPILNAAFWQGGRAVMLSAAGAGLYLLAGVVAMAVMRKIEVR
ncbi:MAG: hypothetical protein LUD12_08865 [Lachnospiraceae bacterium]|nr:hypothetical protein [Lachnospiraceae bacterium]